MACDAPAGAAGVLFSVFVYAFVSDAAVRVTATSGFFMWCVSFVERLGMSPAASSTACAWCGRVPHDDRSRAVVG